MAAPTLEIEEYQFGDDGIVLNGNADLPFVDLEEIQGLDAAPVRSSTKDHEGTDGGFVDSQYETIRTVVLKGTAYTDPGNYEAFMESLRANFAPTAAARPLYYMTDAGPRVVYGKSQGLNYIKTNERGWGKQKFNVTILCEDPIIYTAQEQSITIFVRELAVEGRGYNKGYPYGYGTPAVPNSGTMFLDSTRTMPGSYVLYGPALNPIIVNDTLGLRWTFTIALGTDDALTINPWLKTVRLNGTVSRRTSMKGPWWYLQPGDNDFRLLGSNTTNNVTKLVVSSMPARR